MFPTAFYMILSLAISLETIGGSVIAGVALSRGLILPWICRICYMVQGTTEWILPRPQLLQHSSFTFFAWQDVSATSAQFALWSAQSLEGWRLALSPQSPQLLVKPAWKAWVCESCLSLLTFVFLCFPLLTSAYLCLPLCAINPPTMTLFKE